MKLPLPPQIQLTNQLLRLVSSVDEFKGEWRGAREMVQDQLSELRRFATIESIGSSTRIEGARLRDDEVAALLADLKRESFATRDQQEVVGYADVMKTIQEYSSELVLSENVICQLHRDLLGHSDKDQRHRGQWKTHDNHVAAFDPQGRQIGIVFETASPFETPALMSELLDWYARDNELHPLLRIAVFKVAFLAVHPFQDGNGRLSRVLTNLLLLKAGYEHVAFSSLETVIEHNKQAYYLALRQTQTSFREEVADWNGWLTFFLSAMENQIQRLRGSIQSRVSEVAFTTYGRPIVEKAPEAIALPDDLSPLAGELLRLLRGRRHLFVAEAAEELGANRHTLKGKFQELVRQGYAQLHGKGRGAHYRALVGGDSGVELAK